MTASFRLLRVIASTLLVTLAACDEGGTGGSGGAGGGSGEPVNAPPNASAGDEQVVAEGADVSLNGVSSSDPEKGTVTYQWEQVDGPAVSLASDASARTTFVAPMISGNDDNAQLTFRLTVTDDLGLTSSDTVGVSVYDLNRRPLVNIDGGVNQADAGSTLVLDASHSIDPDGTIASYSWLQTRGQAATITNGDEAEATIVLPSVIVQELIIIECQVTDDEGKIGTTEVRIGINPKAESLHFVGLPDPTNVEVDIVWPALRIEVLNGDGDRIIRHTAASAEIGLEVVGGTGTGTLRGTLVRRANQGLATFNDLSYDVEEPGLTLRAYIVGDTTEGFSPTINVVNTNEPPVVAANASGSTIDALTDDVQLLGSATDDGSISALTWSQLAGPAVTIAGANQANALFDAPDVTEPTDLVFQLRATDNGGKVGSDTVTVTIVPVAVRVVFQAPLLSPMAIDGVWPHVAVSIQNASGARITGGAPASYVVSLALQAGVGDPASLSGTLDVPAVAGLATFNDLAYDTLDEGLVLIPSVASPVLAGIPSTPVDVVAKLPGAIGAAAGSVFVETAVAGSVAGDLVLAGSFSTASEGLDFGFARTGVEHMSAGTVDAFVADYDDGGDVLWVRTFGGTSASAIVTGTAILGDSLVAGIQVNGAVDFDAAGGGLVLPALGGLDIAVAGIDALDGSLDWVARFGGSGTDTVRDVAIQSDTSDTLIVAGALNSAESELDPCAGGMQVTTNAETAAVIFLDLAELSGACTGVATRAVFMPASQTGTSIFESVHVSNTGAVYAAGTISGTTEMVSGEPLARLGASNASGVLVALDPATGTASWAVVFGGNVATTSVAAVASDADGNVYVAGTFHGTFDAGAGTPANMSSADAGAYLVSFDATGALRPGSTTHVGGDDIGDVVNVSHVAVGPQSGDPVVIAGSFSGTIDFNPSAAVANRTSRSGESNGFLLSLDGPTFGSVQTVGAQSGELGLDCRLGPVVVEHPVAGSLGISVAGSVGGIAATADIDPTSGQRPHTPLGQLDAILARIAP